MEKRFTLEKILGDSDYSKRRAKIICTMGPSCWDVPNLEKMLQAGMNVARLNFSHGDHKAHGEVLGRLRQAFAKQRNLPCAVMLDTKGPEIRTGLLKDHKAVELKAGQKLELTTDYTFEGDSNRVACSYKDLPKSVVAGGRILVADGELILKVLETKQDSVLCEVYNDFQLGEQKNMNLPGCKVNLPTVTEKDQDDIVNFGLKQGVDMIALSFTRCAKDIETVRDLLGPKGSHIQIISKIENQEGLHNYDEILKATDGIMVARGDLGMEIPPQKVFVAQKWMIEKALAAGKPIVTATQMLESMIKKPRPTRAEASDVANAILDGTDCVMLSGETANGDFPLNALDIMASVCVEAEACADRETEFWNRTQSLQNIPPHQAIAISAVQMTFELGINVIICFTISGDMARLVSKYRPSAQIIAVSTDQNTIKGLTVSFGVQCLQVPSFQGIDNIINYAMKAAVELGYTKKGEKVIVIMGSQEEEQEESDVLTFKTVP